MLQHQGDLQSSKLASSKPEVWLRPSDPFIPEGRGRVGEGRQRVWPLAPGDVSPTDSASLPLAALDEPLELSASSQQKFPPSARA